MDIEDLISNFSTSTTYQVTRRPRGTYVNGRAVAALPTKKFQIVASVQPANNRDLMRLPEGRRTLESRVLFTETKLTAGGQSFPNEADLVLIDGVQWEVQHVEQWAQPAEVTSYFRCVVQSSAV